MYELIKIYEHDYYIDCPKKIGLVIITENDVIAIDSGNDKDAGKKLLRHLDEHDWKLQAVYNTHSHADHIGGNKILQERTGCKIYAPGLESVYTNYPELETMTLWGGFPFKDLKNKFLMAQESECFGLTSEVLPKGFEIIPLPGHSFDMVGFKTPDGNIFRADCLSSEETLSKYGIGYLWHAGKYIETLEMVKTLNGNQFIPSHAVVTNNIQSLAQKNIDAVKKLLDTILSICSSSAKTFDDLLHELFVSYGMAMNAVQYALVGSTVRSCISYLHSEGRLQWICEDAYMKWQKVC